MSVLESCSSKDEETAIRELVKKGATLGEEQDIKGLMNLTTEDFLALPGDLAVCRTCRPIGHEARYPSYSLTVKKVP
jgi:hypothetical protein